MRRVPPAGIASRALMHRFRIAFSSWLGSHSVCHSPGAGVQATAIAEPAVRRISSSRPATRRLASVGSGSSVCWRENASRRWVRAAPRLAEAIAAAARRSSSPVRPWAMRACISSMAPMMPVSRLLKSWARPPVSWPTASIFCACRSRVSVFSRSAISAWRRRLASCSWALARCCGVRSVTTAHRARVAPPPSSLSESTVGTRRPAPACRQNSPRPSPRRSRRSRRAVSAGSTKRCSRPPTIVSCAAWSSSARARLQYSTTPSPSSVSAPSPICSIRRRYGRSSFSSV